MGKRIGLVAALESEMEEIAEQQVGVAAPAAPESLETEMLETSEAGGAVEENLDAIDSADTDSGELSDLADTVEETVENGGMDATTARVVEVAVESIYKRLGVPRKAMPAMEAFGAEGNKLAATKIALETIKESLAKIWEAIKKAIVDMSAWVAKFLDSIFNGNTKLIARVKSVKEALAAAPDTKQTGNVKAGGFAKALTMGGKFDTVEIIKGLKATAVAIEGTNELAVEIANVTEKAVQNDFAENGRAAVKNVFKGKKTQDGSSETCYTPELPGNRVLFLTNDPTMLVINVDAGSFDEKAAAFTEAEVPTLSKNSMETIVAEVEEITTKITAAKAAREKVNEARAKLLKATGKDYLAIFKAKKEGEEKANDYVKSVQKQVVALNKATTKVVAVGTKLGVSVGKSALDYVETSLAQYKKAA